MLTELAIRKAGQGKHADSLGLHLFVTPQGHKSWRYKFRFGGKEKRLVIGSWPMLSLKQARGARDAARALLASGIDPAAEKQKRKRAAFVQPLDSFEAVARAWHSNKAPTLAPLYARQLMDRLNENVFPIIGDQPVKTITSPQVLALIRKIEDRGANTMARRVHCLISEVFVWAIASALTESDPAAVIRKALKPAIKSLRPAMMTLAHARSVLIATEAMPQVYWATRLASRLLALTAARPGIIRLAERCEFEHLDSPEPVWRIPANKMKLSRERKANAAFEFVIPLATQTVEVVQLAMRLSPSDRWLFPGIGGHRNPISDSTLSKLYRDAGFQGKHVPHGWRASFSTIMNERAAREDRERDRAIIDMMLAHVQEGVEAAYNRAAYLPRRRALAQDWADMLMEGLPPPTAILGQMLR